MGRTAAARSLQLAAAESQRRSAVTAGCGLPDRGCDAVVREAAEEVADGQTLRRISARWRPPSVFSCLRPPLCRQATYQISFLVVSLPLSPSLRYSTRDSVPGDDSKECEHEWHVPPLPRLPRPLARSPRQFSSPLPQRRSVPHPMRTPALQISNQEGQK